MIVRYESSIREECCSVPWSQGRDAETTEWGFWSSHRHRHNNNSQTQTRVLCNTHSILHRTILVHRRCRIASIKSQYNRQESSDWPSITSRRTPTGWQISSLLLLLILIYLMLHVVVAVVLWTRYGKLPKSISRNWIGGLRGRLPRGMNSMHIRLGVTLGTYIINCLRGTSCALWASLGK